MRKKTKAVNDGAIAGAEYRELDVRYASKQGLWRA